MRIKRQLTRFEEMYGFNFDELEKNEKCFKTVAKSLSNTVRVRTTSALKGKSNPDYVVDFIGCSIDNLREYLEGKFKDGMTWENKGEWHIDHNIPTSRIKDKQTLFKILHYSNLQPLWAYENLKKGNKTNKELEDELSV